VIAPGYSYEANDAGPEQRGRCFQAARVNVYTTSTAALGASKERLGDAAAEGSHAAEVVHPSSPEGDRPDLPEPASASPNSGEPVEPGASLQPNT
jgi:hypothetical protein